MTDHESPERRIDITLQSIADLYGSMSEADRAALSERSWWETVIVVSRLRSMERAEEEALGRSIPGLADIYDRIVRPGDHVGDAMVRTYHAMFTSSQTAP